MFLASSYAFDLPAVYLINQTPGEKLRHGVALRASVTLVKSCELLGQSDYFTLVL